MWSKIWNSSNRKVLIINTFTAFFLTFILEYFERKTLESVYQFMKDRTFVFLYNALIIFVILSIVFVVKKKYFFYGIIVTIWFGIGLTNGIVLMTRKTPFTAVDLTVVQSIIPVLSSYLKMWQIVAIVFLLIACIVGLVCLFLYAPATKKFFDAKVNGICVLILLIFFGISTYFGVGKGLLIRKFDNLIAGYKDYGVVYGFCVTAIDTGIDRPIDYSKERVRKIKKNMDTKKKALKDTDVQTKNPNIIFIQLESFFDATQLKNVTFSEDPLPVLHRLEKKTTSGLLEVPVYGAGTINTEFEAITGMATEFFGTGEYPYRSILHKTNCESMATWMKDKGYTASVIHNNNVSFYDRDVVMSHFGFDYFITAENMNIQAENEAGWSKDEILLENIADTLEATSTSDYIYTISVQGHGDYPKSDQSAAPIQIESTQQEWTEDYKNQVTYYVNQIHEMDTFIGKLIEYLSQYDEDVILVAYGDHLPGLNIEKKDLKGQNKFQTPYFIWDNYGYNETHKKKESKDISAYQIASKVLKQIGDHEGVMNEYHQTMRNSKKYKTNMKMLQYDMLYGSDFIRTGKKELSATELKFAILPVVVEEVKHSQKYDYILGKNFNDDSRVYINGIIVNSKKMSSGVLRIKNVGLKDGDKIEVHQVSETNEKVTLNQSEVFEYKKAETQFLYHNEEESE